MLIYTQMLNSNEERTLFENIYVKYRNAMYFAAFDILRHEEDAEDAVHQAFLSILKHTRKLKDSQEKSLCAFVVTVAQNKAIDILRAKARRNETELDDSRFHTTDQAMETSPIPLARLEPHYRQVLILRYVYGYSVKESADIMSLSPTALRKLTERAKKKLLSIIDEKEGHL
ncbi:MAG: sigma-70 family RNA polymerase sigma factor [Clostridia bacterium]|nr:sigma-70 family RNA polymerase sigma factor [Clostridia bacterium]MBR2472350.1 sigma-70 family RNA polymerase sigma factor [Clostridia bacterium]